MDFSLSDEQRMLQETVLRLVRERYGQEQRRRYGRERGGFSAEIWRLLAELGILAVPLPEAEGGFGGGGVELMILHEAFGRGLTLEPYLATVVLGGGLVARLGNATQRAAILPNVIAGELNLALAYGEAEGRYDPYWIATQAVPAGAMYGLHGRKAVVLHADIADRLLVSARTSGKTGERRGVSLFLVDPRQRSVTIRDYATIDGRRAGEVRLDGAVGELLGEKDQAGEALAAGLDAGCIALCAEAVGAMEAAFELTLDYLKTRTQFGGPIGRFQALQHRMVDLRMAIEQARSITILAACSLRLPAEERERRVAAAKAMIGNAGRLVAEQAIQLHGGMGMTDEALISHYAKRLVMIDHWLGDADYHLVRFAALPDATPSARRGAA